MKTALISALLLLSPWAFGQKTPSPNYKVIFHCECTDSTGSAFALSFRDRLATSPRYSEVSDTAANAGDSLKFDVISLDLTKSNITGGAMSIVLSVNGYFIDHWVQTCNPDIAASCVTDVFSSVDSLVSQVQQAYDKDHTVSSHPN